MSLLIPMPLDPLFVHDGVAVSLQPSSVGDDACGFWHYSGTCPPSKTIFGFHEDGRFIGVIAYRHPNANPTSLKRYWEREAMGDDPAVVSELSRIALTPQDERMWPTTKIMRFSHRAIRMFFPELDAIYTYADPGEGHEGVVYKAAGYLYLGRATGGGGQMHYVDNRTGKRVIGRTMASRDGIRSGGDYTIVKTEPKHKFLKPISKRCKRYQKGVER